MTLADGAWRALALAGLAFTASMLGLLSGVDPLLSIALVVGIAFVVTVFMDLALGLAFFVAVTFADILPVGDSPLLSAVKVAGAVLALSWIALIATRGRDTTSLLSHNRGLVAVLIVFTCWAALSALWSADVGEALLATQRYALNFLLFPIVFAAIDSRRDLVLVLAAWKSVV